MASRINSLELNLLCIISWRIWCLRNSFVHNGGVPNYYEVLWWSRNFAGGCQAPSTVRTNVINSSFGEDCGWKVLELGLYKANCSARSDVFRRKVGIEIVIRDNSGAVMASCSQIIDACYDERVAGIIAIYRGILFSKDCGLFTCVFESDKRGVVNCIQSGRFLDASYGNIISAIADLRLADNSMKIRTIPRLANQVAQRQAINALVTLENSFWMED
ncbi:hypothetical protein Q3G72_002533 [Acer saccharum]|nr:hypothetical protein Q3G72_002533 [Acer saccharum]